MIATVLYVVGVVALAVGFWVAWNAYVMPLT